MKPTALDVMDVMFDMLWERDGNSVEPEKFVDRLRHKLGNMPVFMPSQEQMDSAAAMYLIAEMIVKASLDKCTQH